MTDNSNLDFNSYWGKDWVYCEDCRQYRRRGTVHTCPEEGQTKQPPPYQTIEIRLPLTTSATAYATIEMAREGLDLTENAIHTMEARIAVLELQNAELRAEIRQLKGDPK